MSKRTRNVLLAAAASIAAIELRDAGVVGHEIRCFGAAELRAIAGAEGKPSKLLGYAARYNTLSEPLPIPDENGNSSGKYFRERIAPGAFKRALTAGADVRALVNHKSDQLLGRTTSGTLRLEDDERGLKFEVDVPDTQAGRDAMQSVQRRDMDGCSFGFRTIKDSWAKENGETVRTLIEVDTLDVGPVTFPAYSATSVDVRSARAEISKLDAPPAAAVPAAGAKKQTALELRTKFRGEFDRELRALMEYDDKSLIWACRCAIEYFRSAFDYAQYVIDTVGAVAGELTEQDQQAVDDCMDEVAGLIVKAKLCRTALQGVGAADEDDANDGDRSISGADSEMRRRVLEMASRGLEVPAELRAAGAAASAKPAGKDRKAPEPAVRSIEVVNLKKDDTVLVHVDTKITTEQRDRIQQAFRTMIARDGLNIVVLDAGMRVSAIHTETPAAAKDNAGVAAA